MVRRLGTFEVIQNVLTDRAKMSKSQSVNLSGTLDGVLALKTIEAIKEDPSNTIDQISERTGIARRTLVRYMDVLMEEGRIEEIGGKRYGHWKINE